MSNVKCTNEACAEHGVVKTMDPIFADMTIMCGECWSECEQTDEPLTEAPNANPAN